MAATVIFSATPAISSLPFPNIAETRAIVAPRPNSFRSPNLASKTAIRLSSSSLWITTHERTVFAPKKCRVYQHVFATSEYENSEPDRSPTEVTIDLKLPRRSLSVQFTCDACGERTQRLVNRLAYERGTVFVQCAGCLQHHKLVDNLGLVVEYDLQEDMNTDLNAD